MGQRGVMGSSLFPGHGNSRGKDGWELAGSPLVGWRGEEGAALLVSLLLGRWVTSKQLSQEWLGE